MTLGSKIQQAKTDAIALETDIRLTLIETKIRRLEKAVADLKIYKADKQTKRTDEDWEQ